MNMQKPLFQKNSKSMGNNVSTVQYRKLKMSILIRIIAKIKINM